ncbi:MAG: molybdopterin-dependent oxidoreductase [Chloroflexota bacterium]
MAQVARGSGRTRSAAWAGFAAGSAALAAALLLRLVTGIPSLFELIGEAITFVLPVAVFDSLLGIFGPIAKPLMIVAVAIGAVGTAAGLGAASARIGRTTKRATAIAAAGGVLGTSGIPLLFAAPGTALIGLPVAALYAWRFWAGWDPSAHEDPDADLTRRHLLQWAAVFGVVALAGIGLWRLLSGGRREVAGALPQPITPNEQFYVISKNLIDPAVDVMAYRLTVGGMVATPQSLTMNDLRAMAAVDQVQTLECISNEVGGHLISTAAWRGVRLRDVLEHAAPTSSTVELKLTSEDGYTESIPLEMAADDRVLLAYDMNAQPLPQRHGFPLRLLLPGVYGMKGPKWLTRIEAIDAPYDGYWEQRGWTKEAYLKTMSRIDTPASAPSYPSGRPITLSGIAFASFRGITKVELRIGSEDRWVEATLDSPFADGAWRFWRHEWTPDRAGSYPVNVRATDGEGTLQEARLAPTLPDGASGYDGTSYTVG